MRSPLDDADFIALLNGIESPTPDWGRVAIIADWCEERDYQSWSVVFRLAVKNTVFPRPREHPSLRETPWYWSAGDDLPYVIRANHREICKFGTFTRVWEVFVESYENILEQLRVLNMNRDEGYAIFARMLDTPDDDAARLILADWLQENGREGLAEQFRQARSENVQAVYLARLQAAAAVVAGYMSGPEEFSNGSVTDLCCQFMTCDFKQALKKRHPHEE
jgi:uncharacterized protein (TIGR02996 family)